MLNAYYTLVTTHCKFLFLVLYDCFKFYDKSGDGIIDRDELPEALRFAGINPSKEDIEIIIKLFDSNGMCFYCVSLLVLKAMSFCAVIIG